MVSPFPPEEQRIVDHVRSQGHGHVLRWLGELDARRRRTFLGQLERVDFERVRAFGQILERPRREVSSQGVGPAPVQPLPRDKDAAAREEEPRRLGAQALREDRVAALTVAGGQGTRLGYDGPKGTFPITPLLGKSLFQVQAEKILAARRRYRCRMPWLIMTSPANDRQTRDYFRANGYFGLQEDSVRFFTQGTNPILDASGRLLLRERGELLVGPDGHGGVFEALASSGLIDYLREGGFDLLSYFQVDNPLVTVADERFIGHHLLRKADFSCKVIPKRDASEGLGVAVLRAGRPEVIEYSDLPGEMAEERTAFGKLKYRYGSIAVHVISTDFAHIMGTKKDALPWHVAQKRDRVLRENGQEAERTCYKFERFVFDCLPHASACAFVEVERESEFAPVKNAHGEDSPDTCRRAMRELWLRWMREAGVEVGPLERPEAGLEISPLFGEGPAELKRRLPPRWRPRPPVVLEG